MKRVSRIILCSLMAFSMSVNAGQDGEEQEKRERGCLESVCRVGGQVLFVPAAFVAFLGGTVVSSQAAVSLYNAFSAQAQPQVSVPSLLSDIQSRAQIPVPLDYEEPAPPLERNCGAGSRAFLHEAAALCDEELVRGFLGLGYEPDAAGIRGEEVDLDDFQRSTGRPLRQRHTPSYFARLSLDKAIEDGDLQGQQACRGVLDILVDAVRAKQARFKSKKRN